MAQVGAVIGWLTPLLSLGAMWLRHQATWLSNQIEQVERANQKIEALMAEKRAEYRRQAAQAEQHLNRLNAQ